MKKAFTIICLFLPALSAWAAPTITDVQGKIADGQRIQISGSGFTDKPREKPLLVWQADEGEQPTEHGRIKNWSSKFTGEVSTEVVAPNSSKAFRIDHGATSGAALAGIDFDSDRLFVHRKTYEAFDVTKNIAIRTRISNIHGVLKKGQLVTGETSGATGIVLKSGQKPDGSGHIFFDKQKGSISEDPPTDFVYGEKMYSDTATFRNAEGNDRYPTGTFRTFNFKTMRLWHMADKNNIHFNTQGANGSAFKITPEATEGTLWQTNNVQRPFEWKTEDLYYKTSDIGKDNGVFDFLVDNQKLYNSTFITRDKERPRRYNKLYQSQVSNGAQPASWMYYDKLYVDDSWHHVALCEAATWDKCESKEVQIPTAWSDTEIELILDLGSHGSEDELYLYVVDASGTANPAGHPVCSKCPSQISLEVR